MTIDLALARKLLRSMPSIAAMKLARQDPDVGLPQLRALIRAAELAGDSDEEHVLSDGFVTAACETERWLGTAERLARKLVGQKADRYHLKRLARVLSLRGKAKEASELLRRAEQVPDEHLTPEVEAAIAEAEALAGE